jgi:hypothetical protein
VNTVLPDQVPAAEVQEAKELMRVKFPAPTT